MKYIPLDKYGWPVERYIGRPITNLIRIILHTRSIITKAEWDRRQKERYEDSSAALGYSLSASPRDHSIDVNGNCNQGCC